ncbi:hypothetical protein KH5H1_15210 [Corallococcus caeni]|nr:hypothetical protein KH5H1_15210 [Corallococcus sp. KH5-1]
MRSGVAVASTRMEAMVPALLHEDVSRREEEDEEGASMKDGASGAQASADASASAAIRP